ncbi:MAG: amidohydrolase family protein [Methanocalculaceae archaeon]|jgi:adenine deaminase|nr:amidohydrolase family protein [Methanocalculaceae archaeon]
MYGRVAAQLFYGGKRNIAAISANHNISGDTITDLGGARVSPGLIDTHPHTENSFLVPHEFGRTAPFHGVTTAIADPHKIANVAGFAGIDFMI